MRVRVDRSNDREAMASCDLGDAARGGAENELVSLLDRRFGDPADRLDEPLLPVSVPVPVWLLSGNAATRQRQRHQKTHYRHTRHATPLHRTDTGPRHTHLDTERWGEDFW